MENTSLNHTELLASCDDQLTPVDAIQHIFEYPKDVVSNVTNELKRSSRLSRKRVFKDEFVSNDDQSHNTKKQSKIESSPNCVFKATKLMAPLHCDEEIKDLIIEKPTTYISNNNDINEVSIQSYYNTIDDQAEMFEFISHTKNISVTNNGTEDDISNDIDGSDNFAFTQKSDHSSLKNVQFKKKDLVNHCNNEIDEDQNKRLTIILEELRNNFGDSGLYKILVELKNKELQKTKKLPNKKELLGVNSETNKSKESISLNKLDLVPTSSKTSTETQNFDCNDQLSQLQSVEYQIYLLSKRLDVSPEKIRTTTISEPLSLFKNYSKSITSDMLQVSRIIPLVNEADFIKMENDKNKNKELYKYFTEPMKDIVPYEKPNLKEVINELSKTMPSWSLCIVRNPSRYVISHTSIGNDGFPYINKAIIIDNYFIASVIIYRYLINDYCKLYKTAAEIINLIKKLDKI